MPGAPYSGSPLPPSVQRCKITAGWPQEPNRPTTLSLPVSCVVQILDSCKIIIKQTKTQFTHKDLCSVNKLNIGSYKQRIFDIIFDDMNLCKDYQTGTVFSSSSDDWQSTKYITLHYLPKLRKKCFISNSCGGLFLYRIKMYYRYKALVKSLETFSHLVRWQRVSKLLTCSSKTVNEWNITMLHHTHYSMWLAHIILVCWEYLDVL